MLAAPGKSSGYKSQITSFASIYFGLAKRVIASTSPIQILMVPFLGVIGAVALLSVLKLIATFVSEMGEASNSPASLLFGENQLLALAILSLCVLMLLLIATGSTYFAALLSRRTGRQTYVQLVKSAVLALGKIQFIPIESATLSPLVLKQHFTRNSLHAGMAAESMLGLLPAIMYVLSASVVLMLTEPWISLVVLGVGVLMLPAVYSLSQYILRNAEAFYSTAAREHTKAMRNLANYYDCSTLKQPTPDDAEKVVQTAVTRDYLDRLDTNRLASYKMYVLATLFLSAAVSLGIFVFGWLVLSGGRTWDSLIVYAGALFLFMRGLQGFMSQFAILNRFYPQIRSLITLLDQADMVVPPDERITGALPDHVKFLISPQLDGSLPELTLDRCGMAVFISSNSLRRHSLRTLALLLEQASGHEPDIWCGGDIIARSLSPDEIAAFASDPDKSQRLRSFLTPFADDNKEIPTVIEDLECLPADQKFLAATMSLLTLAVSAANPPSSLRYVSYGILSPLSKSGIEKLLSVPFSGYSLIVASASDKLDNLPPSMPVLVVHEDTLVGAGDLSWWQEVRAEFKARHPEPSADDLESELDLEEG